MKERFVTMVLFAVAITLHALAPPQDKAREIAESLIGPAEPMDMPGLPAFQSGEKTVLFFQGMGMRDEIEGVLVIEGDAVQQLRLLKSKEGHTLRALQDPGFIDSFRGKRAHAPVVVQSVTGATISSQALMDAVNARLAEWQSWRDKGDRP